MDYEVTIIPVKDNTKGNPSSVSGRTGTWKVYFTVVDVTTGFGIRSVKAAAKGTQLAAFSCMTCSQVCLCLLKAYLHCILNTKPSPSSVFCLGF